MEVVAMHPRRNLVGLNLLMGLFLAFTPIPLRAADRFWVGSSSFWDIASNWSTTQGGIGGARMPGDGDNAYILLPSNITVIRDAATPPYLGPGPALVRLDGTGTTGLVTLNQTANTMAATEEDVGFNG